MRSDLAPQAYAGGESKGDYDCTISLLVQRLLPTHSMLDFYLRGKLEEAARARCPELRAKDRKEAAQAHCSSDAKVEAQVAARSHRWYRIAVVDYTEAAPVK